MAFPLSSPVRWLALQRVVILLLLGTVTGVHAQKEKRTRHFGNGAGLDSNVSATQPVMAGIPPSAAFDYVPVICEGACDFFTDTSEGAPDSWQWSFPGGNPATSSERSPRQVCYASPGLYTVTLIVSNAAGSDTISRTLRVRAQQLEVDTMAHPSLSRIELDSTLLGETRCDSIVLHNKGWTPLVLTAREVYMLSGTDFTVAPGQYPIVIPPGERRGVRICYRPTTNGTQHDGLVLVDSCILRIVYIYSVGGDEPPRGSFSTSVEPCRMECIDFTAGSAWARSWRWRFPGAFPDTSSLQTPRSICYAEPGDYAVTLIVENRFGADTLVRTIHVGKTPRPSLVSSLDGNGVLEMGVAETGSQRWDSVVIRAGSVPVEIVSAHLAVGTIYSLPPSQFPLTIPAGGSRSIVIGMAPSGAGDLHDTLVIDDPCVPLSVPLSLHADPPALASQVCSARLVFGGVADAGLLRIEGAYPNPARTRLRVPVEIILPAGVEPETRCTLHDPLGREMASAVYAGRASRNGMGRIEERGAFTIEVSALAQGRYYLRLTIGENVTTIPVEVER
jgi:PKD repeat protein